MPYPTSTAILEKRSAFRTNPVSCQFSSQKKEKWWRLEGFVNPLFIEDSRF